MNELCLSDGVDLASRLRSGDLSSRELVSTVLDRVDTVDPRVNAIVSARDPEEVLADAAAADAALARGETLGPLHGLPMAVKDLADVRGLPTRRGSLVTSDGPAETDTLFVERLRAAGVVFIGKTNTPELGTGSHTFNEVFGVTRNPYDLGRSAGGSSGGAAAALATGMVPLADGSDLGGSLRNPASFCNVIGFRPSIGRVPDLSRIGFHPRLSVTGPMARSVADVALLLSVMAGPDRRDPRSLPEPGPAFASPTPADLGRLRIAWGGDLGLFPVQTEVMAVVGSAVETIAAAGATVESDHPDLSGAMEVFRVLRALVYRDLADEIPAERHSDLKATIRYNMAVGLELSADQMVAAERARTAIHRDVVDFFDRFDLLALPTVQVLPFPVDLEYPSEIDGRTMSDYLEWMSSCCVITVTGCPAVSVPAGFSSTGLPVGLQLVAAPGEDRRLLGMAAAIVELTGHARVGPPDFSG